MTPTPPAPAQETPTPKVLFTIGQTELVSKADYDNLINRLRDALAEIKTHCACIHKNGIIQSECLLHAELRGRAEATESLLAESIIQQIRYLLIHSHDLEQAKGEGVIPGDGRTRYRLISSSFATVQDTLKIIRAFLRRIEGK